MRLAVRHRDDVLVHDADRRKPSTTELIALGRDREAVAAARGLLRPSTPHPKGMMMTATLTSEDLNAIKTRQQATWASGDYAVIGTTLQIVGEALCEAVDLSAGWRVLDVAAGNGNASLAAARRGCDVIASDYVEALLDGTRRRAI